ncbi:12414_t:CDS:2 [Cetraspora pellucida]|uniref:12414_t:CDS:1 n=1 Tax=Cetraspora pellucida TaxID=1433469 RepID=A0A9N8ZHZ9_9GLOM|nr:12414_t:CDS:2 [Cetraspora pellucida]
MANDPLTNHGGLLDQVETNGITTAPAVTAITAVTSNGTSSTPSTAVTAVAPTTNTNSLFEKSFIPLNDQAGSPENKSTEGETKEETGEEETEDISNSQLTIRALVSTKEAGVIIGKAGKNVAELRETTGVKAGVSKVVQGVHDRVLSVAGTLDGVAKAYSLIAQTLLENPVNASPTSTPITPPPNAYTSVRLLISHNLMGTIIGRQGLKIKHIQDVSGARMVASKEMLPQSTERVVEVQGTVDAIRVAVWEIGKCLIEDNERGIGTVLYNPAIRVTSSYLSSRREYTVRTGSGTDFTRPSRNGNNNEYHNRGSKISEIRRLSGSRISIAKTPHDETGERMFTIQGTPEANEKALYLLYNQLESEKERRLNVTANGDSDS